jgi:hypothetical protein
MTKVLKKRMTDVFSFFYTSVRIMLSLEEERQKYTDFLLGGGGGRVGGLVGGGENWLGKRKVFSVLTVDKERV